MLPIPRFAPSAALCLAVLASALVLPRPALAWTDESRVELVQSAVRLMPESLRDLMIHHERELLDGVLHPGSAEDQPEHWQHPDGRYGAAALTAEEEAQALIASVDGRARFGSIMHRFGKLAHWVSDVNNPLHAGDPDPRLKAYYRDYQGYLRQQMASFPLVFEGYRSDTLTGAGPAAYLMESAERARGYARAVARAYDDEGKRLSAQAFDVRSLPFGVGSLSYSHAVSDITRVWLWTWEQAHGDTTRTPLPLVPVAKDQTGKKGRADLESSTP